MWIKKKHPTQYNSYFHSDLPLLKSSQAQVAGLKVAKVNTRPQQISRGKRLGKKHSKYGFVCKYMMGICRQYEIWNDRYMMIYYYGNLMKQANVCWHRHIMGTYMGKCWTKAKFLGRIRGNVLENACFCHEHDMFLNLYDQFGQTQVI